jgi:hypothetical protein
MKSINCAKISLPSCIGISFPPQGGQKTPQMPGQAEIEYRKKML